MKKIHLLLFAALILLANFAFAQQGTISGVLVNELDGSPIENVTVKVQDTNKTTITDAEGKFAFSNMAYGNYTLLIETAGEPTKVQVNHNQALTSIKATVLSDSRNPDNVDANIPTIVISDTDDGSQGADDISGILTASRDAFNSAAAYVFSFARFRVRGYDSENTSVFLNNISMNDPESGRVYWGSWGGLNDVMRNRDTKTGLQALSYSIGGLGGGSSIDARASTQRKQLKFTYSSANRSYRNRLMLTYSTGMLKGGWAVSLSGSRRWAKEGYIDGTFYDAWSYFASIEKKLGDKHALSLTTLGAPSKRGRRGASTQELYELAGSNYYNSYWGYQNGEKRNSRVSHIHRPLFILAHNWAINDKNSLKTSVSYQFGRNGSSALDWYNAPDPRPDYYRNLPSFVEDSLVGVQVGELLSNNDELLQLDWHSMYDINYNSMETIEDANGIEGNDVTGKRSKYIVEERRYDSKVANVNTTLESILTDRFTLNTGANFQWFKGDNFKTVDDLLGGDFYVDLNRFAERDFPDNPDASQNDLNNPNRVLEEGDRFGYDYNSNIQKLGVWAQLQYSLNKVDLFAGGELSQTQFWRTGNVQNGLFPDNSFGDSEKQNFLNYAVKGGLTYKINGRNYLYGYGTYRTRAPYFRNAYVSPRTRNELVPHLTDEKIAGGEVGYVLKSPYVKARATGYLTQFWDQTRTMSFFHEDERSFVNYSLSGIDKQHLGVELAAEVQIVTGLTASAVAAIGQYIYTSRPLATITQDNDAEVLVEDRTVYQKNFYIPGTPQSAYTLGFNYRAAKYWFASINFNYFNDTWIDFNPDRRTAPALDLVEQDSDLWRDIIHQQKADGAFTIDLSLGKSWMLNNAFPKLKRRYFLNINANLSNLLNNKDIITGGYEQLRYDFEDRDTQRFPPRYYYANGLTFFINASFRM